MVRDDSDVWVFRDYQRDNVKSLSDGNSNSKQGDIFSEYSHRTGLFYSSSAVESKKHQRITKTQKPPRFVLKILSPKEKRGTRCRTTVLHSTL